MNSLFEYMYRNKEAQSVHILAPGPSTHCWSGCGSKQRENFHPFWKSNLDCPSCSQPL